MLKPQLGHDKVVSEYRWSQEQVKNHLCHTLLHNYFILSVAIVTGVGDKIWTVYCHTRPW